MLILMALLGVFAYTAMNAMKLQFDIADRAATMEADICCRQDGMRRTT